MKRLLIIPLLIMLADPAWAFEEFEGKILQDGTAIAAADGAPFIVGKYNTVGVELTISASATVTFEGSVLGVWSAIPCLNKTTGTSATTATATGLYVCDIAGLSTFRARVSTFGSGTITAFAKATTASLGTSTSSGGGGGGGDASEAKQDSQITQETAIAGGVGTAADAAATTGSTGTLNAKLRLITTQLAALATALAALDPVAIDQTTPGTTNGVWINSLGECEDETNNLCMVGGGKVRTQTVATGMVVGGDATMTTAIELYTGWKTFQGSVTGTGAITQVQTIYGGFVSPITTTNGSIICTITLSGTTSKYDFCQPTIAAFPYYGVLTSSTTGTGASGEVKVGY